MYHHVPYRILPHCTALYRTVPQCNTLYDPVADLAAARQAVPPNPLCRYDPVADLAVEEGLLKVVDELYRDNVLPGGLDALAYDQVCVGGGWGLGRVQEGGREEGKPKRSSK